MSLPELRKQVLELSVSDRLALMQTIVITALEILTAIADEELVCVILKIKQL